MTDLSQPGSTVGGSGIAMRAGSRHGPGDGGTSVWRRPRWPDGRLMSPFDDRIPPVVRVIVYALAFVGFWSYGQPGSVLNATVPFAPVVLVLLLIVALCCWLVSNGRLWALADAAPSPLVASDMSLFTPAAGLQRLWRPARWPDGRYVGGGDRIAVTASCLSALSLLATGWVLGTTNVAGLAASSVWWSVGVLLCLPMILLSAVSSRRLTTLAEDAVGEDDAWQAASG